MKDHSKDELHASKGGALSSKINERFDLICPTGLRRIAARYALGAEKYTDYNWCNGGGDVKYFQERLNHLIKHVNEFLLHGNESDDNLAAIAWNAIALMHYEEGCKHHEAPWLNPAGC